MNRCLTRALLRAGISVTDHRLPHDVSATVQARAIARERLAERLSDTARDDFVLMVSELVANAVRHAPPDEDGNITLKIDVTDDAARAVVIDAGTEFEFERATFDGRSQHFGLQLVDRMASRWGLSLDGQKAVWFEVDR
ncbi:MAG TPA: ATP-binding protein [Actinomycetota bacterium]|nr:ATP-binding protein [Actinomycetota bacterium]